MPGSARHTPGGVRLGRSLSSKRERGGRSIGRNRQGCGEARKRGADGWPTKSSRGRRLRLRLPLASVSSSAPSADARTKTADLKAIRTDPKPGIVTAREHVHACAVHPHARRLPCETSRQYVIEYR